MDVNFEPEETLVVLPPHFSFSFFAFHLSISAHSAGYAAPPPLKKATLCISTRTMWPLCVMLHAAYPT